MRPIECSSATPSGANSDLSLCEKYFVVIDSDMLEHADRDDSVIAPVLLAVVAQVEPDAIGEPRGRGEARRHLMLLDGEGETGHVGAALDCQVKSKTAPARADIKHPLAWANQQLCRNMPFLVELRRVEVARHR